MDLYWKLVKGRERKLMKAAFIVFDGMTALDFIGFYDPITRLKSMKIIENFAWNVCAQSAEVTDDRGLKFKADTVGGTLEGYDMIVVPGGFGSRTLQHDDTFMRWI